MLKKNSVEDRNQRVEVWVFINILTLVNQTIDWIRTGSKFPVFSAQRVWRIYCPQTPRLITNLLRGNSLILLAVTM